MSISLSLCVSLCVCLSLSDSLCLALARSLARFLTLSLFLALGVPQEMWNVHSDAQQQRSPNGAGLRTVSFIGLSLSLSLSDSLSF